MQLTLFSFLLGKATRVIKNSEGVQTTPSIVAFTERGKSPISSHSIMQLTLFSFLLGKATHVIENFEGVQTTPSVVAFTERGKSLIGLPIPSYN